MSAPAPAELCEGLLLAGKYRLERLLGQGGMGAVWLAEHLDIGRKVAIKVLLPQFAQDTEMLGRFRQEARAAAAIGHPGIVDVLDLGAMPDGSVFIVMESLQGETLAARLHRAGPLTVESLLWVASQSVDAIAAAHEVGIVHRDLKPDNLFLTERPVRAVKLLDFGISKFRAKDDLALTRTGVVMGTPLYMSPEQARGAKDVGPATDLYSLGAILYHALAGVPPFLGDSYNEVMAKVLVDQPVPIREVRPDLSVELARLIDALLLKTPAARPPSARAVQELLARCRGETPAEGTLVRAAPAESPPVVFTPRNPSALEDTAKRRTSGESALAAAQQPQPFVRRDPSVAPGPLLLEEGQALTTPRAVVPVPQPLSPGAPPEERKSRREQRGEKRRGWIWVAIGLSVAFGLMSRSRKEPEVERPAPVVPPEPVAPPVMRAPLKASLPLVAVPAEVRWYRDGKLVCNLSVCHVTGDADSSATYLARLGAEEKSITVTFGGPVPVPLSFETKPAPQVPPTRPPPAPKVPARPPAAVEAHPAEPATVPAPPPKQESLDQIDLEIPPKK